MSIWTHRIDRDTAGLVMFSANPSSRERYHALFSERGIRKHYEAIARPLPALDFPLVRCSRLVRGEPFFRMQEEPGPPNSETRIDVLERGAKAWRYGLQPVTGRKHQLRVHMAGLAAPILNDRIYPRVLPADATDPTGPLQLLASRLQFDDPVDGSRRAYQSRFELNTDLLN